ncbi:MAG: amidohydrolase family protein [Deltaproteobacteria bacterium]|nr:amidohydrolase family protein [Deltaproteobacteria bacterium]
MKDGYLVIDADGHVGDDETALRPYVSPQFRKRPLLPRSNMDRSQGGKFGKKHQDPKIQIEDMDVEGIDVMTLYGTGVLAMWRIKERELSVDLHRAYNDWLADFCGHNPDRLKGVAALPMIEPDRAARELERAVTQLGFIGGMAHTTIFNHHVGEPCYDELYACAQQYNVPIAFHASGSEIERFDTFVAEHTIGHTHEQICSTLFVVYCGVLDKFPRLRVAFLEGLAGWVPSIAQRMDEEYERRPHDAPLMTKKPTEYFREGRIFFGIESEEWMLPVVIRYLGTDKTLMFSSDYPHWDGEFPNATKNLVKRDDLTDENKRNILGENARRFYGGMTRTEQQEKASSRHEAAI